MYTLESIKKVFKPQLSGKAVRKTDDNGNVVSGMVSS